MNYDCYILNIIEVLASIVIALFTALLYCVAKGELKKNFTVNRAEFESKIKNDFFTEKMLFLFFLIENDLLIFELLNPESETEVFYFKVSQLPPSHPNYGIYYKALTVFDVDINYLVLSTYYIDFYLLNHFVDIERLRKSKILTFDAIYDGYDYYLNIIMKNPEIMKYINFSRLEDDNGDVFEELFTLTRILDVKK